MYNDPEGCGSSASRVKDELVSFMGTADLDGSITTDSEYMSRNTYQSIHAEQTCQRPRGMLINIGNNTQGQVLIVLEDHDTCICHVNCDFFDGGRM